MITRREKALDLHLSIPGFFINDKIGYEGYSLLMYWILRLPKFWFLRKGYVSSGKFWKSVQPIILFIYFFQYYFETKK
jgi:hypothetical protein